MSTTKKFSGKAMGYLILLGLVVLSWAIFKILSPHNFGSFGNMLNYFQAGMLSAWHEGQRPGSENIHEHRQSACERQVYGRPCPYGS